RVENFLKNMSRYNPILKCSIANCCEKYYAKKLCRKHYGKLRKYGDPNISKVETHRMTKTAEYLCWVNIKRRCYNPNNCSYKHYGGRGISCCDRWLHSFENFLADMGKKPTPQHQIDRINVNGNYEPSNCRWVLCAINCRNRRNTRLSKGIVNDIRRDFD